MDSILKIKYIITDVRGRKFETDSRAEALASFEEGRLVSESHETTWSTNDWISGKNIVEYEWHQ